MADGNNYYFLPYMSGWSIRRVGLGTNSGEVAYLTKADGYTQAMIECIVGLLNKQGK